MLPIYWRTYTLIFGHARPQGLFELSLRRPSSDLKKTLGTMVMLLLAKSQK